MIVCIDWQGLSALATLLAVMVALVPIAIDFFSRRARSRNLQFLVLNQLLLMMPMLQRRLGKKYKDDQAFGLDEEERAGVVRLESLFSQAHILPPRLHDALGTVVVNVTAIKQLSFLRLEDLRQIKSEMDRCYGEFQKGGFLRSRGFKPTWGMEPDTRGAGASKVRE